MSANTPLMSEATGYPTQKPEKLLDRILRASSVEGSLVIDPCAGSGTTLVAAHALKRRFFGCDIGSRAIAIAGARLQKAGATFTLREPATEAAPTKAMRRDPKPRASRELRSDPSS